MQHPLLVAAALAWVPMALLAALDPGDVWWPATSAVAFLPYAAVFTLLVVALSVFRRARVAAGIAALGVVVLVGPRLDRFTADRQPRATGPVLRVATSNVHFGTVDPQALLALVRRERVDVLALQEDTADLTADLDAAGLRRRLPYGVLRPAPGARGLSLYSRWPITVLPPRAGDRRSVAALVQLPGGTQVAVRSFHPRPPYGQGTMQGWHDTTAAVRRAIGQTPAPTIIMGDFNATLDHHPLRSILRAGYRDAAEQTGQAWRPTWSNGNWATLSIDHVLVPRGVAVRRVSIHDLAGTDHDAVVSTLRLPG